MFPNKLPPFCDGAPNPVPRENELFVFVALLFVFALNKLELAAVPPTGVPTSPNKLPPLILELLLLAPKNDPVPIFCGVLLKPIPLLVVLFAPNKLPVLLLLLVFPKRLPPPREGVVLFAFVKAFPPVPKENPPLLLAVLVFDPKTDDP